MSVYTLKKYLALDVIDSDPDIVSASNSVEWPTSADVDDYAYKSLGTIWVTASCPTSDLESRIVYRFGEGKDNPLGDISLITLPEESIQMEAGLRSNIPGAIDEFMEISYRLPDKTPNWEKIKQASFRIRYLLDLNWRRQRKLGPVITLPSEFKDKSLAGGGILMCRFLGAVTPPHGIQYVERWIVSYRIIVPKIT